MKMRPRTSDALWMAAGAALLALVFAAVWHFHQESNPAEQLASKASRVDRVARMQLALSSASEAEKSAVLAVTDQESLALADQARAATAQVESERQELGKLLATGGTEKERALLAQFTDAFGNLRHVDAELLDLAVKNTNVKAYALAFGPTSDALAAMEGALARVIAKHANSPDAKQVMLLAFGARVAVLRIQTLLAPHIAEESDAKMDEMERRMGKDETEARSDLENLAASPRLKGDPDVNAAVSSFARYEELKARILALSRENTNVRSLALSLNQKRKAMIVCLDALGALKEAILEEPIAGVTYGKPPKPR